MISYGKSEQIPQLKAMWHKVFGDSEEYLDAFFSDVFRPENTLVYSDNSLVVSALYMVPYTILTDDGEKQATYLYALSTEPSYRGRGIMSKLVKRSLEISWDRGCSLSVLIPSEKSLFDYYRQFGYEECFNRVTVSKTIEQIETEAAGQKPLELSNADAGQIWKAYIKSQFYSLECIVLSEAQNRFYIEMLTGEGGEALTFGMEEENDGYAILQQVDDKIVIHESNVSSDALVSFYAALLKKYSFTSLTFHQPICFGKEEVRLNTKPFAMAKGLDDISLTKPFIGRVLM